MWRLNGGFAFGTPDPVGTGPFEVGQAECNLSVGGFSAPAFGGEDVPIEERAAVFYPRPLACGPFPVVLIMHGSHGTCYAEDNTFKQDGPCPGQAPIPLPSFRGYDDLAERLASNGLVVVSISANGINAAEATGWDEARGELFQHHLDILHEMNTSDDNVCRFGTADWPRLSSAEQHGALIATASAFFRAHLRGENELEDGAGLAARVAVAGHSSALFFPPSDPDPKAVTNPVPHALLNTIRVPLGAFGGIFTTDARAVRLVFDRTPQGAINVGDLALANPADNLSPAVACTVAQDTLVPNGAPVDVGLDIGIDDADASGVGIIDVDVFSDQDDDRQPGGPHAVPAPDALELRGGRDPGEGGRIYLIVSRVVDGGGARGFGCCTVTVPQGDPTTGDRAVAALQSCASFAAAGADLLAPPAGYFRVGE